MHFVFFAFLHTFFFSEFYSLTSSVRIDDGTTTAVNGDGCNTGGVRCRVKHVIRAVILSIDINTNVKIRRILLNKIRCQ